MWKKINDAFERFLSHPRYASQTLILLASISCLAYNFTSDDTSPFSVAYRQTNTVEATVGFILLVITLFFRTARVAKYATFIFITQLNIINIFIIYLSNFKMEYYYQYVVFLLITSWFFDAAESFLFSIFINFIAIAVLIFYTQSLMTQSDFYLTFLVTVIFIVPLMLRKLNKDKRLKASEEQYRLLGENSADIICTHRQNGEFAFVSPSMFNFSGYQPEELIGKPPVEWIHPEDVQSYLENFFNENTASEFNIPIHYRFRKKSGSYTWMETIVKTITSSAETKTPEVYLSQTRSFQRNKEYQTQLEENAIQLQKSYRDLEMFAYITSHDMQEPLRMISNYIQLIKRKLEKKNDDSLNEYLAYTTAGAQNLQMLIKDILTYSTTNKIEVPKGNIDTEMLLKEILESIHMLVLEKDVEVRMPEICLPLRADKNFMLQVFQNLILNGIKYNVSPKPLVTISCVEDLLNVTYSIKDNGIGIEPKYFEKIFEPFQRLHNKYDFPGTGLGLPICKKIIEKHGGKIWVTSEENQGATFSFFIPKQAIEQN